MVNTQIWINRLYLITNKVKSKILSIYLTSMMSFLTRHIHLISRLIRSWFLLIDKKILKFLILNWVNKLIGLRKRIFNRKSQQKLILRNKIPKNRLKNLDFKIYNQLKMMKGLDSTRGFQFIQVIIQIQKL